MTRPVLLYVAPQARFFLSHRLSLAVAAKAAGFRVVVACTPDHETDEIEKAGLEFRPIAMTRSRLSPMGEMRAFSSLRRLIAGLRPDAVHLITAKAAIYGGFICRLAGVPSVAAITGLGDVFTRPSLRNRLLRPLVLAAYRLALRHRGNHFIFQNADDRAVFAGSGLLSRSGVSMIDGSGVDLDAIAPQPFRDESDIVALLPARLLKTKGLEEYVVAAQLLRDREPRLRCAIAGDLDTENPAGISRDQIDRWTTKGIVEWWGFERDPARMFARCDFVVLPSHREGFPKSLIDAAAAARAIVTTDVPGCRDAIIADVTGLLCAVSDPHDLAEKMLALARDPGVRRRMGDKGRLLAERRFDLRRIIAAHIAIYRAMIPDKAERPTLPPGFSRSGAPKPGRSRDRFPG